MKELEVIVKDRIFRQKEKQSKMKLTAGIEDVKPDETNGEAPVIQNENETKIN